MNSDRKGHGVRMATHNNGERDAAIWQAYIHGTSQPKLSKQFGLSQARISVILKKIRESIPQEDRATIVIREMNFLDDIQERAMEIAKLDGAPVVKTLTSDGTSRLAFVHDENGEIVRDYGGQLAAIASARATAERRAKLLGLDAAQKLETTTTVVYEMVDGDAENLT